MFNCLELEIDIAKTGLIPTRAKNTSKNGSPSSAPGKGQSLAFATERKSLGVRAAVNLLAQNFKSADIRLIFRAEFAPRWQFGVSHIGQNDSLSQRAAWNLVAIWCLAQASGDLQQNSGLHEAAAWFRGSTPFPVPLLTSILPPKVLLKAHQLLLSTELDNDFWELFPYILDEHGPGSRSSVMRDPSTAVAREAKRKKGVFYTPSDVADYMVRGTVANYPRDITNAKCFDPACGTGVILLAMFRDYARHQKLSLTIDCFDYITNHLYGCDISAHALDAASFVLLRQCLQDIQERSLTPWAAWQAIRLNFAQCDSTTISQIVETRPYTKGNKRLEIKECLITNRATWIEPIEVLPDAVTHKDFVAFIPIQSLFVEAQNGFDLLIANPPYAAIGSRPDFENLTQNYACLAKSKLPSSQNIYPLFIEMMWRLTVPGMSSAALVTPLSVSFHRGLQYQNCRAAMQKQGGEWQFAFFDREPHALFGEEVKTRNAILFRFESDATPKRGVSANIETGPLRKWTSRTRHSLFESIDFTPLDDINITTGIPKLNGTGQSHALNILSKRTAQLPSWCVGLSTCRPSEACSPTSSPRIFVGGTAYNFLNIYRNFTLGKKTPYPMSASSVHCLQLETELDANAVFAILSSRLVFWLWHMLGDGFHVSGWLFDAIPFARRSFSDHQIYQLAELGDHMWTQLQSHRIVSINGGKQTIAFRPLTLNWERDAIDTILIEAAGLPSSFVSDLRNFVHKTVVVDPSDKRRQHLQAYFN